MLPVQTGFKKEENFYILSSRNKGADQLHCYRAADLRLCFNICKSRFSHDAAHVIILYHDRHVEAVRCILGYPGAIHFVKLHSAMNVGYGMRTVRLGDR